MPVIEQQLKDGILTIILNRPDKLNALNNDVLQGLSEVIATTKEDKKVKALLITGSGKAFCAGADISRLAECNVNSGYEFARAGQIVFRELETLGKPSLAAVNGFAFGGGCELLMSTTMRIASTKAQFGQPEVKLGVIPGYGGTQRLSRLVGKGRALDLCLTGRFIDAQTALSWGLVTEVTEPEDLIPKAKEYLQMILAMSPLAVKATMDVIDRGYDMNMTDAMHMEATQFANVCGTKDKSEGVSAFLEKRTPKFIGE